MAIEPMLTMRLTGSGASFRDACVQRRICVRVVFPILLLARCT
jgi:hypothetical protein